MKKSIVAIIAITVALIISDQIIYGLMIVPRLSEIKNVPIFWWIASIIPMILASFLIGSISNSFGQLILLAIITSIITLLFLNLVSIIGMPGHYKSIAIEGILYFWGIGFPIVFLVLLVFQALGRFLRRIR